MSTKVSNLLCLTILLLAASGASARAQDVSASITGFVRDSAGAVVAGATVTVVNGATGEQRVVTTDDSGQYTIAQLPIGTYTLTVEQTGFKKHVRNTIELHVNDKTPINVDLGPGNVRRDGDDYRRRANGEDRNAHGGGLITGEVIREMPLNNRNFAQLTQLVPGVSSTQASTVGFGGLSTVAISINGGRTTAINWSIDGSRNVDTGSNATLFNYLSIDAIAEFKILTNSYDAQFGRNAGGVVSVVTRSGTRDFHGGVYEFLRNRCVASPQSFPNHSSEG